jgi:hypothetical protein
MTKHFTWHAAVRVEPVATVIVGMVPVKRSALGIESE